MVLIIRIQNFQGKKRRNMIQLMMFDLYVEKERGGFRSDDDYSH